MTDEEISFMADHIREGIDISDFLDGKTVYVNKNIKCICRKINNNYYMFKCDDLTEYIDCKTMVFKTFGLKWIGPDLHFTDADYQEQKYMLEKSVAEWIRKMPRKKKMKKFSRIIPLEKNK